MQFVVIVMIMFLWQTNLETVHDQKQESDVGRKIFQELGSKNEKIRCQLDNRGAIRTRIVQYFSPNPLIDFYENTVIQSELELVASQKTEFDSEVKKWRTANNKIVAEFKKSRDYKTLVSSLNELNKKYEDAFARILLPQQVDWIRQIQMRYLIRAHGITKVLKTDGFRQIAKPQDPSFRKLNRSLSSIKKSSIEKLIEAKKTSLDKLLQPLTKEQKRLLYSRWPYLTDEKVPNFEQYRLHLLLATKEIKSLDDDSIYKKIMYFPFFELSVAGIFESQSQQPNDYDKEKDSYCYISFLDSLNDDGELAKQLSLSDYQTSEVDRILNNFNSELSRATQVGIRWNSESDGHPKNAQAKMNEIRKEVCGISANHFQNLLTKEQASKLELIAESRLARKSGFLYELLDGDLGHVIGLKDTQKKRIRDVLPKVENLLNEKTVEIEDYVFSAISEKLPEECKAPFQKLVGTELKQCPGSVEALLLRF